jgi:hypothetical protein
MYSQAENDLSDKEKRENLDGTVIQARFELLRSMNLPTSTKDDYVKLKDLAPPWKEQVKQKVKMLLIEEELRRRRYAHCIWYQITVETNIATAEPRSWRWRMKEGKRNRKTKR